MGDFLEVRFALPDVGPDEMRATAEVLERRWLTTGPECAAFEEEMASNQMASHAVAVSSCTAAIHLALVALGVGPGDEVVVPTHTFSATAEAVWLAGAQPVLADVDPVSLALSPETVSQCLTSRTRAIVPVHFAGHPCHVDDLVALARQRGIHIVWDAAHAFGTVHSGVPVGGLSDVVCFSFYANKPITTGEGGMALTNDATVADQMREMRTHGMSKGALQRFNLGAPWEYDIGPRGFKYNMSDLSAAMGRVQLARSESMRSRRQQIAEYYLSEFEAIPGKLDVLKPFSAQDRSAWHLFVARTANTECRDGLINHLARVGVATSVHYKPLHMMTRWATLGLGTRRSFPNSEDAFQRSVSLPLSSVLSDEQVEHTASHVRQYLERTCEC